MQRHHRFQRQEFPMLNTPDPSESDPAEGVQQDNWFAFMRDDPDDGFQAVRVNQSLHDEERQANCPIVTVIVIPFANEAAWPETPQEWDRINAVEDELQTRLPAGAVQAGAITAGGSRDLIIYASEPLTQSMAHEAVGDAFTYDDPEWNIYYAKLWPSPEERRRSDDDMVIGQASDHGDDPTLSRTVDHFAYFESSDGADAFQKSAEAHQAEEGSIESIEPAEAIDEHFPAGRVIKVNQSLKQPDFTKFTVQLMALADDNNGYYDGWETPIAKAT